MLKVGLLKKLFHESKYVCATTINNFYPRHISTTQKYFLDQHLHIGEKSVNAPIISMNEVKNEMMKRLGLDDGYAQIPKTRHHLTKHEPKLEDLPPRTMLDSFTSALIPLSTDKLLQDKYVTTYGHVRLGRLMEDMDMFAVWVCHKHLHIPNLDPKIPLPYTFVTILVDKVDFTDYITHFDKDIRLSGHVSWVGRTSMETVVWLEQLNSNGVYQKITRALFLMAARNAINTKAAPVNPLKPGNNDELKIFNGGEDRKNRRSKMSNISLLKVEPNDYEQKIIHDIFMRTIRKESMELNKRILPMNCKWMEDTVISNLTSSFPENRNAHNKVFGGHLMKMALEISWVCAFKYCGRRPKLENICDISFQKPVDVASFIKMSAHIVYTEMNYVQIMTIAQILNFGDNTETHTSNVFYYTFKNNDKVHEVLPRTYHEAMWYLEGRRKLSYALNLNNNY